MWRGDGAAMHACFAAMMDPALALGILVLDLPRGDRCSAEDWQPTLDALAAARAGQDRPMAVLSSLPEGLPETVAADLIAQNIVPLNGMDPALQAIAAVAGMVTPSADPLLLPKASDAAGQVLHEAEAKSALAQFGLKVPGSLQAASVAQAVAQASTLGYPVVLKAAGWHISLRRAALR